MSLANSPLPPDLAPIVKAAANLYLRSALKGLSSFDIFETPPPREAASLKPILGGGVQKVAKQAQALFSNDEIRAAIHAAVKSKRARRELYKVLPAAKGKLPKRLPVGLSSDTLAATGQQALNFLQKKKGRGVDILAPV